jgi:hypothetical protein
MTYARPKERHDPWRAAHEIGGRCGDIAWALRLRPVAAAGAQTASGGFRQRFALALAHECLERLGLAPPIFSIVSVTAKRA